MKFLMMSSNLSFWKIPSKKVVKSAKAFDSLSPSLVLRGELRCNFHSIKRSSQEVMVPALLVSWSLITQIQL